VPEYARQYLAERQGVYAYADLVKISLGQSEIQASFEALSKELLILDTGQEVLYIWSMHKYGKVDARIESRLKMQNNSFHLLCKPDLEWVPDPLRENENDRDILFHQYEALLQKFNLPYGIIEGEGQQRLEAAIDKIEAYRV